MYEVRAEVLHFAFLRDTFAGMRSRTPRRLRHEPAALTYAREQAGLTQTQLAERLGVSVSLVSEMESGTRSATPTMLNRLAEALRCPRVVLEAKREVTT